MFDTPILLISWRRPEKTLKVIKEIRKIKPNKLYLACDGPIKNDPLNQMKVTATREVLNKEIDWDCEIKKLYSEKNNGCMMGVSKAITWFFKNEEEGIILEDDCVPHKDFFYFCSVLLDIYRFDKRIWSISAHNQQNGKKKGTGSYYFSRYSHCWGWASWRRCWDSYDPKINDWPKIKKEKVLNDIFSSKLEIRYWENIFDSIYYKSEPNTWDYQWTYTCFKNSGLTIIPNINLINNIGFDVEATHTKNGLSQTINKELKLKESGIFPIKHPITIVRSKSADNLIEFINYSGYPKLSFKGLKKFFLKLLFKSKNWLKN